MCKTGVTGLHNFHVGVLAIAISLRSRVHLSKSIPSYKEAVVGLWKFLFSSNENLALSNEVIKAELPPRKVYKAGVLKISPSLELID